MMPKDELDINEQIISNCNDLTENIPGRFDTIRINHNNEHHQQVEAEEEETILNDVTQTIASLSLRIDLANDTPLQTTKDLIQSVDVKDSKTNNSHNSHHKPTTLMKDLNKDDRLRIIREKHEQELAKKKKELEENLKRKEELWFKQQREKQRRIDEYKLKENEKRLACEERRRKREENERVRLNEIVKREQERTKVNSRVTNAHNSHANDNDASSEPTTINKSQSAYNLSNNNNNSRRKDNLMVNSVYCYESSSNKANDGLSKRLANSTMRLATKHTAIDSSSLESSNTNDGTSSLKRRSRTVPTNKKQKSATTSTVTSNFRNTFNTAPTSGLYWEGPPAHFMLPTHAIHCRLSRSVERCPRACKALTESTTNGADESYTSSSSKHPLQTINERNKPLSAHLQQTINRLSMPKKQLVITENDSNNFARSATPQPSHLVNDINHTDSTPLAHNVSTSSSNSFASIPKKSTPTQIKSNTLNKSPLTKKFPSRNSISTAPAKQAPPKTSRKAATFGQSSSNGSIVSLSNIGIGSNYSKMSSSTLSLQQQKNRKTPPTPPPPPPPAQQQPTEQPTPESTTESDSIALTEEEEYKIKIEAKRKEVREKAAKEAELERQRQELIQIEEEKKRREEEEQERLAEEEFIRLNELARQQENERLRLAIEENERIENERRVKEEAERQAKEHAERKQKEEAEKQERDRLDKIKKEEEERLERRKKIDMIMKRVQPTSPTAAAAANSSSSNNSSSVQFPSSQSSNLLLSASNIDLTAVSTSDNNSSSFTATMTTSMINTPLSGVTNNSATENQSTVPADQRFKTPLLQSILSKTRITTILNKYADDSSLNNPTLSLIAQNSQLINSTVEKQPSLDQKELLLSTNEDENERPNKEIEEEEEEVGVMTSSQQQTKLEEVSVVVDSSSPSSSPSSPSSSSSSSSSSNSNRSSQQASPSSVIVQPAPSPAQTQIIA